MRLLTLKQLTLPTLLRGIAICCKMAFRWNIRQQLQLLRCVTFNLEQFVISGHGKQLLVFLCYADLILRLIFHAGHRLNLLQGLNDRFVVQASCHYIQAAVLPS